jgi:hypothetical protein
VPIVLYSFFFGQADPRFVWNKNLLEELIEAKVNIYEGFDLCILSICILFYVLIFLDNFPQLDEFIIPLIQGNIQKMIVPCHCLCIYLLCMHNVGPIPCHHPTILEGYISKSCNAFPLFSILGGRT